MNCNRVMTFYSTLTTLSLEYGLDVDPDLPVVNVGTRDKPVYLPADVCEVEAGQPVKNKLSPQQTQNMLRFAVMGRTPAQNAQSIATKGLGVLGIGQPLNATLVISPPPIINYHIMKTFPT